MSEYEKRDLMVKENIRVLQELISKHCDAGFKIAMSDMLSLLVKQVFAHGQLFGLELASKKETVND